MLNSLYSQIDWQKKWYQSLFVPNISKKHQTGNVADWLNNVINENRQKSINDNWQNYQHQQICFVPQEMLPKNLAYETFISQTGKIATRNNFHDLFNGLIWLNYPKTKAILNYLHHQDIEKLGVKATRSPLRNALTLFDENGGIVVSCDKPLLNDLQKFHWQTVLWHQRQKWLEDKTIQFFSFGHALLEKLMQPRKNICSHVLLLQVLPDFFIASIEEQRKKIDTFLSQIFLKITLQPKIFQPLPVLGIPDFCLENRCQIFYQDSQVFRLPRATMAVQLVIND